jgi:hypothetical protein
MAYGIIVDAPMPIDMYRAVNAQVAQTMGDRAADGLLVHVARPTAEGFQVIEVWESKQQCDKFQDEVLGPIIDRVSGGQAPSRADVLQEFEVENLMLAGVPTAST